MRINVAAVYDDGEQDIFEVYIQKRLNNNDLLFKVLSMIKLSNYVHNLITVTVIEIIEHDEKLVERKLRLEMNFY